MCVPGVQAIRSGAGGGDVLIIVRNGPGFSAVRQRHERGQAIVISTDEGQITVRVLEIERGHRVKLGIEAPESVVVDREEVADARAMAALRAATGRTP